jgi:lipoprotein-releasing system ATP-binding protein
MSAGGFLSARGLEKGFPSGDAWLTVLKGVDLDLAQGEVAALTGPSGVGKSTLLHLVAGLDKPDRGHVSLGGEEVTSLRGRALDRFRNRAVGIVYQFHFLLPEFSALENAMVPAIIAGEGLARARESARALLDRVGLSARAHHRPSQLSGGEQQRASLARALVNRPKVLLADEPTGNLDEGTAGQVFDLLLQIRGELGLTVLLATHNAGLAGRCDRILALHDGRLTGGRIGEPDPRQPTP